MHIVLLQTHLKEEEIYKLPEEFPQFLFLSFNERTYKHLGKDDWEKVEILYGSTLTESELKSAPQLKWIHSPSPNLNNFCIEALKESGRILVTTSQEENKEQIGEFVMAGVLTFAKNLIKWKGTSPHHVWDSELRNTMWELKGKIFLQIGLGQVGKEIAKRAKLLNMKVWGIHEKIDFEPTCDKVFTWDQLEKVLPSADIVSIALPRNMMHQKVLPPHIFELFKEDVILSIIGPKTIFDEEALLKTTKFRGILWDSYYGKPLKATSKLWELKNILITPEASPRPKSGEEESLHLFRHNLRQYLHGNFTDMRHIFKF